MKTKLLIVFFAFVLLFSGNCFGQNVQGYDVQIRWNEKSKLEGKTLEVSGNVSGRDDCNDLAIKITFRNSNDGGQIALVNGHIRPYHTSSSFVQEFYCVFRVKKATVPMGKRPAFRIEKGQHSGAIRPVLNERVVAG